jgi:hypothetical protein
LTSPSPPSPDATPPVGEPTPQQRRGTLPRRIWHAFRGTVLVVAAILVALLVAVLTIDLGPALRGRAEREGSKQIQRPMRIGHLSVRLLTGRFVVEDLLIEGVSPRDRPFFHAKRVDISMPWWTIARGQIFFDSIVLSDWQMLVESFPNGRHNFIRIPTRKSTGPKRFVTTVQLVRAERGQFTYEDHGVPWSTVARNLDLTIAKLNDYRGEARFTGGTVQIMKFEPMWANMFCTFKIDGSKVVLDRIDLDTDGARSRVTGTVDLARWPEQTYQVQSSVAFPRMREIFWAGQRFGLHGDGRFSGTFHLFKGGRELKGTFASAQAGLNTFRFPELKGEVTWLPDRLEVSHTSSRFYGGRLRLGFVMSPLGQKRRATARLDTAYEDVDLATFTDFLELPGIRLAGRARGRNFLEWPLGGWENHKGQGEIQASPPGGGALMRRDLADGYAAIFDARPRNDGAFDPTPIRGYLPVGGTVAYRFGAEWIDVAPSEAASPNTYVSFEGRTAYGKNSRLAFHVTSGDWQESDRILAGIIGAFGSPTRAVPVGGFGTFDGVMTGNFSSPRIEGRFAGDRLSAWDVTWGAIGGEVAIENAYVDVTDGRVVSGDAHLDVDGRFSIGFPRRDGGDEIDARIRASRWSVTDFRHAFRLDDYDLTGLLSGEFHVYAKYQQPQGFGRLELDEGVAYGEPFERATAGLRFEGRGVRLDGIEASKSGGTMTGAAFVGWDGTYSFNATGRRVPVESIAAASYPQAPLSGLLQFTASGSGTFSDPRYEMHGRIDDLFVGDEGIGQVIGDISVRDNVLTIDRLEAASPRLAVSGSGRIALTPGAEAELVLRVSDTSLDPYVRSYYQNLSPYTTAVVSGTLRLSGPLRHTDGLKVDAAIEQADLRLFDYRMRNDGTVRIAVSQGAVRVERLRLVGEGTAVEVFGDVDLGAQRIALRGLGDVNLGVIQGFLRDIRSSGAAELQVDIRGPLSQPIVLGSATLVDGRIRHFALPHALESLDGRVEFAAGGIRLDGLTGRFGGGPVKFDGSIGFKGFSPQDYAISAVGENMRVRYPEGFRSVIDADLALRGNFWRPTLSGLVRIKSAVWNGAVDTAGTGIFGLAAASELRPASSTPSESLIPVRFDVRIEAPSTLRIENRAARLVSSAELTLRGNYDRPLLFGRVEVERGEVFFEGNRYEVTRGTVDFANPTRIEPFFDLEAETRARVPGETYRVVFHGSGTAERFVFDLTSDPPLSQVEIVALLFGDVRDPRDPELRQLREPGRAEQEILAARAARLLTNPISSEVGRVVEEAFGVDTVQITPSLGDIWTQQLERINPSARLTIGKRLSDRLYLTYSQAISSSARDQIILIEFNQSDRLSWVLSQNEDQTYAVNVRVRHVF